jgi:hypothetical protein
MDKKLHPIRYWNGEKVVDVEMTVDNIIRSPFGLSAYDMARILLNDQRL